MRVLTVLISLVCFAVPVRALAKPKPKIAVAPLQGDTDGKIAEAVVDALAGKDFAVVTPADVGREIKKLGLSHELDAKAVRKLTTSLEVVAIVRSRGVQCGKRDLCGLRDFGLGLRHDPAA